MIELHSDNYENIRPLLLGMDFHLVGRSILSKQTPAQIFVDNSEAPKSMFAQAGHRYILAGNTANNDFNRSLQTRFTEFILPQVESEGMDGFALYYDHPAWEEKMPLLIQGKKVIHANREYYVCKELKQDWRTILPNEFQRKMVNADLLATSNLKHLETLKDEMTSERPSVNDFLSKSFGVCAVREDELAGWCLSEYNADGRCEIGIETTSNYRHRGIATALTLAFLEHAFSHGIHQVGWHCFKRNEASAKTALKAGFDKVCDYKSFIVLLKEQP